MSGAEQSPSKIERDAESISSGMWLVLTTLTGWFTIAFLFGYFELIHGVPFWVPPMIPIAATIFFSALFIWYSPLRHVIMTVDMSWLVSIGFLRGLSFYIGYLSLKDEIPASFAIPAEIGVTLVIVTAVLLIVIAKPLETRGRRWLIGWNAIGALQVLSILALVVWHILIGLPPRYFATLPLNLFPTFIIPLSGVGHILIAYRLRTTRSARQPALRIEEPNSSKTKGTTNA